MNVSENVLAAMRRTNELMDSEVLKKQNIDAFDLIYTASARILPPGGPMIQGRENIKSFWKQAIAAMGATSVKLSTVDAEAAGDGVVEIGSAELTVAGGQMAALKYVVYWKQEDGVWKWNVDIWNANA
jgi:ketosteroid isomerase-like protein